MSVSEMIMDNALREPSSSQGVFELPCGYVYEDDAGVKQVVTEVELREMTGEEEDLLASRKVAHTKKMDLLLASCIKRIGDISDPKEIKKIVPKLLVGDRTYLFLALRQCSLGDDFPVKEKCSQCAEQSILNFDLSQLKLQKMPEPSRREYCETLPSGKDVVFRCLSGEDDHRRERLKQKLNPLSLQIFLRLVSIDGASPTEFSVRGLTTRDRDYLRGKFALVDGGVDTTLEVSCPLCGFTVERDLDPGLPSFFSPSETSALWKRKFNT